MGLDIYLYKYEDLEKTRQLEKEYQEKSEKIWEFNGKSYDELTEEEKEEARKKDEELAESLGLGKHGESDAKEQINQPSKLYPDHYFKLGYFRSSYNDSGIERILGNLGVGALYHIFEPNKEYHVKPDWEKCLDRTNESIAKLKEIITNDEAFCVAKEGYNIFHGHPDNYPINSEEKTLETFLKEKRRERKEQMNYSNGEGTFYLKNPLQVYATIQGVKKILLGEGMIPCTYLVFKHEGIDWYLQALEIVRETIDYVLAQEDKQKFVLHWSS